MPVYDLYCENCGNEINDVLLKMKEDFTCPGCNELMIRKCNCKTFKLVYNNKTDVCSWGDHDYAKSQYYRKVNEERAKGKDVRAPE